MFRHLKGYQLAVDFSLAGLFHLVMTIFLVHTGLGGILVLFGFSAALALRRLSPNLSLIVAWAAAILQMASLLPLQPGDVAVLAVLFSTAAYGGRTLKWLGLASAGVGAIVATAYLYLSPLAFNALQSDTASNPGSAVLILGGLFIASISTLGLSWTLGLLARALRTSGESRRLQEQAVRERRQVEYEIGVEQERNRIARDMHDVVAHSLAVVIAQADGARYSRESDPGAVDESLETIASTAREALGDVRMLLGQLRHSQAAGPQPVLADLTRLYDQLRAAGLTIVTETEGTEAPLSAAEQLAVYRIAQESLTNALRHGDTAKPVFVRSRWEEKVLTFAVHNLLPANGPQPAVDPSRSGHGIAGMTERAALVGGSLSAGIVEQGPAGPLWFGVVLTLPIASRAALAVSA
jgi:signal transduction histidine kinase